MPKAHAKACPLGSEEWRGDRDVRGSIAFGTVGRITPTLVSSRQGDPRFRVESSIRRSGLGRRENARSSGHTAQSPNSAGCPRSESCGSEPETREVRVHASRTGGRSRSDASRVLLAGRSQGLVVARRALAGRKLEAPPDAGHERRKGEPVRGSIRFPIRIARAIGLWVSARRLSIRRKAFSGTHASGLYRQGAQGPLARRSNLHDASTSQEEIVMGSTSGGFGDRLGCACE